MIISIGEGQRNYLLTNLLRETIQDIHMLGISGINK